MAQVNLEEVRGTTRGRGSLTIIHKDETHVFCPGQPIPAELRREVDQALRDGRASVDFEPTKGECDEAD